MDGRLSLAIVAQSPQKIASAAGIEINDDVKFFMVEETGIGKNYPFSWEKLSVVVTLYRYSSFDDAIRMVNEITGYMGSGHSCSIHSTNDEHIMRLGMESETSRVMVRQATSAANTGNWDNGMPFTMTLGCGTWGGNSTSENVTWKHMINTTWMSFPVEPLIPSDEELFGEIMKE